MEGAAKGRAFSLDAPNITIGRVHPETVKTLSTLLIPDDTVSRIQAELRWEAETQAFRLFNRSETNPTKVNDVAVDEALLAAGDQIRMGLCVLDLQQADMRFGGDPDRARRAASNPISAAPPLPKRLALDEKKISTKVAPRVASLTNRAAFALHVVEGPLSGQQETVTGLIVALGGPVDPDSPPLGKTQRWFDQEFVLADPSLPGRQLALTWKELANGFELSRPAGGTLPVSLERHKDGMEWSTPLPLDRPALVRPDDWIRVGEHVLRRVMA